MLWMSVSQSDMSTWEYGLGKFAKEICFVSRLKGIRHCVHSAISFYIVYHYGLMY